LARRLAGGAGLDAAGLDDRPDDQGDQGRGQPHPAEGRLGRALHDDHDAHAGQQAPEDPGLDHAEVGDLLQPEEQPDHRERDEEGDRQPGHLQPAPHQQPHPAREQGRQQGDLDGVGVPAERAAAHRGQGREHRAGDGAEARLHEQGVQQHVGRAAEADRQGEPQQLASPDQGHEGADDQQDSAEGRGAAQVAQQLPPLGDQVEAAAGRCAGPRALGQGLPGEQQQQGGDAQPQPACDHAARLPGASLPRQLASVHGSRSLSTRWQEVGERSRKTGGIM